MKKLSEYIVEEGAWGYEPDQSDGCLDFKGDMNLKIAETIYDECFKYVYGGAFDEGEEVPKLDGNSCWGVICVIEHFFEKCKYLFEIGNDDEPEYERYYYWWRLKDRKQKDIVDLYSEAISRCNGDKEFIDSWNEPEKMKESLKKRSEILKKYADMRDAYFKKQISNERNRVNDTINKVNDPNYKPTDWKEAEVVEGGEPAGEEITTE